MLTIITSESNVGSFVCQMRPDMQEPPVQWCLVVQKRTPTERTTAKKDTAASATDAPLLGSVKVNELGSSVGAGVGAGVFWQVAF